MERGRFSCSIAGDSTLLAAQRTLRGAYVLHGGASRISSILRIQVRPWLDNRSNSIGTNMSHSCCKECEPLICGLLYVDTWPVSRSLSLTFLIGDANHEVIQELTSTQSSRSFNANSFSHSIYRIAILIILLNELQHDVVSVMSSRILFVAHD